MVERQISESFRPTDARSFQQTLWWLSVNVRNFRRIETERHSEDEEDELKPGLDRSPASHVAATISN